MELGHVRWHLGCGRRLSQGGSVLVAELGATLEVLEHQVGSGEHYDDDDRDTHDRTDASHQNLHQRRA
jgi:hypothetical protein